VGGRFYLVRLVSAVQDVHVQRGGPEHRVSAGVIGEPEKLILRKATRR
jgi:hypothetical protein